MNTYYKNSIISTVLFALSVSLVPLWLGAEKLPPKERHQALIPAYTFAGVTAASLLTKYLIKRQLKKDEPRLEYARLKKGGKPHYKKLERRRRILGAIQKYLQLSKVAIIPAFFATALWSLYRYEVAERKYSWNRLKYEVDSDDLTPQYYRDKKMFKVSYEDPDNPESIVTENFFTLSSSERKQLAKKLYESESLSATTSAVLKRTEWEYELSKIESRIRKVKQMIETKYPARKEHYWSQERGGYVEVIPFDQEKFQRETVPKLRERIRLMEESRDIIKQMIQEVFE